MKRPSDRTGPRTLAHGTVLGLAGVLLMAGPPGPLRAAPATAAWEPDLEAEPHRYFQRTPRDRFSRLIPDLAEGRLPLDRSSERALVRSLLRALDIPESSQLLVFSNTSLQLSLIHPGNPRALYFSDELYLGHVPGGKIEVATLDPDLGAVFYLFDLPREGSRVSVERARRCMNCHANEDTMEVPGLSVKSVAPGPEGGSLDTFRAGLSGHAVPLSERLGGWYVTGTGGFDGHWGNRMGRLFQGELGATPLEPGRRFSLDRYPVATSDFLAHLLHEHQVGGVNRLVRAQYRWREVRHRHGGYLPLASPADLEAELADLVGYLLFAGEVPLPAGGIAGDPAFREAFARNRREVEGRSLKDFDLRTRLMRHRCSYLVHTPFFDGLDPALRHRILGDLDRALADASAATTGATTGTGKGTPTGAATGATHTNSTHATKAVGHVTPNAASRHLGGDEAATIRRILKATVPGYPGGAT
ncbi:MAG: hypothetical protein FJ396_10575 [Verrucomicrobia bacterium]|nr:hypothetical protein [Verrucomicrobiota bacterium]